MKIRSGFVSNSSSSSFIVQKKYLSQEQICKIENHIDEAIKILKKKKNDERYEYTIKKINFMDLNFLPGVLLVVSEKTMNGKLQKRKIF